MLNRDFLDAPDDHKCRRTTLLVGKLKNNTSDIFCRIRVLNSFNTTCRCIMNDATRSFTLERYKFHLDLSSTCLTSYIKNQEDSAMGVPPKSITCIIPTKCRSNFTSCSKSKRIPFLATPTQFESLGHLGASTNN